MKKRILFFMVMAALLSGCASEKFVDNKVYVIESDSTERTENFVDWLDVTGVTHFSEEMPKQVNLLAGEILLTIAPDGKSYYIMSYAENTDEQIVLSGDEHTLVNISRVDMKNQLGQLVAANVPFITKCRWNEGGDLVAFCGSEQLIIYNADKNQLLLEQELSNDAVNDFFWSPVDTNKLYVDHLNAAGSVYYVDPQEKIELYETREKIYYKEHLEKNYYYGTMWRSDANKDSEAFYTVLVDDNRQLVKTVGQGSFLDSYYKSVLLLDGDRFGLTFVADINQVSRHVRLSDAYIYDAGFYSGGGIYAVIKENPSDVHFILLSFDASGNEIHRLKLSGSSLLLSGDGTRGYSNGYGGEVVDLVNGQVLETNEQTKAMNMDQKLYQTLKQAAALYGELYCTGAVDLERVERCFSDNGGLAKTEMTNLLAIAEPKESQAHFTAILDSQLSVVSVDNSRASCYISFDGANDQGEQFHQKIVWDAVNAGGEWSIIGFSNFIQTPQYQQLLKLGESALQDLEIPAAGEPISWTVAQLQFFHDEDWAVDITAANKGVLRYQPETIVVFMLDTLNNWIVEQIIYNQEIVYQKEPNNAGE